MNLEQQQEIVRTVVSDYFDKHAIESININLLVAEHEHIIYIGTSLLCTKWNVGYPGGDFVKAIIDNDLSAAFARADHINQHCIRFYVMLMYNVGMPTALIE
jgi:hypothetical protein